MMKSLLYVSSDISDVHIKLLNGLRKRGVDCKLFYFNIREKEEPSIDYADSITYSKKSKWRGPLFFINRLEKAAKHCMGELDFSDISITHANMLFRDGFVSRAVFKRYGIPYVVSVRNTDMNLKYLWALPWVKRHGINQLLDASAIICLSKPYCDKLLSKIPVKYRDSIIKKVHIVPNGIDDFWFDHINVRRPVLEGTIRFITVGRIEDNKNQLRTARAIHLFNKNTGHKVHYTIVGDCLDIQMKDKIENYDFIEIKPYMKKEKLINEYRKSDIFIMPSHTETFGLVYVEALTQGLPVIYTEGQGFDEQFEEGTVGVSVNSNDESSIEDGIRRVIEKYEEMSENAIEQCDRFKWSNVTIKMLDIYSSCLMENNIGSKGDSV